MAPWVVWVEKYGLLPLGAVWIDFLGNCWLICGLVWLWSSKDVKNDMWVVKGKLCQNFPRPVSIFFFFLP